MTNKDTKILISKAYFSRWSGWTLMIDYTGNIYFGKNTSYSNAKWDIDVLTGEKIETPAYYDNTNNNMIFLSANPRIKYLMAGKDFTVSQDELLKENFFYLGDYIKFTQLLDGVLGDLPNGDIMKFAGDEFERYYLET